MIPLDRIHAFPGHRHRPSPNFGPRRGGGIRLIVLHATAGTDEGAESWMVDPGSQVSAHLHIRRDGTVTRHVADAMRAWHAGRSDWEGLSDVNSVSLGWEIGNRNDGREPYTDAQYKTVARLLHHYLPQGLERSAVVSHAAIAPGRKTDPYLWDWGRMWKELDRLEDPLAGVQWPTPELATPKPAPPRADRSRLLLEPIEIPDRVPENVTGTWGVYSWAREVAQNAAAEAASRSRQIHGAEHLVDQALRRLMKVVATRMHPVLLAILWPFVERAADRVFGAR